MDQSRRRGGGRLSTLTLLLFAAVTAVFLVFIGTASATLAGSTFNAGDGNMKIDGTDTHDWQDAASYFGSAYTGDLTDLVASTSDDAFTPGQKQDTVCPDVSGQKSPSKDDFTDAAYASETNAAGDIFLYLATFRFAGNGNASENIELNQGTNGTCTGGTLLKRVVGDKLIAVDYLAGGTSANFNALTWIDGTDANNPTCYVDKDTPPCWGAVLKTLTASDAEAKENGSTIPSNENYITSGDVGQFQFAEFGINLTKAIGLSGCGKIARTEIEARASGSSFVSSTKDIVLGTKPLAPCPKITTTASGGTFAADGSLTLSDKVTIKDAPKTATGKITVKMYGPGDSSCSAANPRSVDLPLTQVSGDVNHDYTANFSVSKKGDYNFTADLFLGNSSTAAASSPCGAVNETATASPRPVTIATSAGGPYKVDPATGKASIKDTATLSNKTSDAGGTVTYTLYGPDPTPTSVPTDDCDAPHKVGDSTVSVTNGVVSDSDFFSVVPGLYHWSATYSGDDKNSSAASNPLCGATGENPLVISPAIDVSKTPANQSVPLNTAALFHITVTNVGDSRLTDIVVSDVQATGCVRTAAQTDALITTKYGATHHFLDPGESFGYDCNSDPVAAPFTNVVEACGTDPLSASVCDTDTNGGSPPTGCPATEANRCAFVGVLALSSVQDFKPKDTASNAVTMPVGVAAPLLTGKFGFYLYKVSGPNQCDANHIIYNDQQSVTNDPAGGTGNVRTGSASTSSSDFLSTLVANAVSRVSAPLPPALAGTAGTYKWLIIYSADGTLGAGRDSSNNGEVDGACGTENFVVSNG
jgi:hypothetical protein